MITLDTILIPEPSVVGRILEDQAKEAVLVLPSKGQVKVLNEVGARIWALVDGRRTVREIAAVISTEYTVVRDVAEKDTLQFLYDLYEKGVVQVEQGL
jgi:hypothetical protein